MGFYDKPHYANKEKRKRSSATLRSLDQSTPPNTNIYTTVHVETKGGGF